MKNLLLFGVMAGLLSFIAINSISCSGSPTQPPVNTPVPTTVPTVTTPIVPGTPTPTVTMTSTPTVTATTTPTVTATVTATVTPNGKNLLLGLTASIGCDVPFTAYYYVNSVLTSFNGVAVVPSAGATWFFSQDFYTSGEIARIDFYGPTVPSSGVPACTAFVADAATTTWLSWNSGSVISAATTVSSGSYTEP